MKNIKRFLIGLVGSLLAVCANTALAGCTTFSNNECFLPYNSKTSYCSSMSADGSGGDTPRTPSASYIVSYGGNYFYLNAAGPLSNVTPVYEGGEWGSWTYPLDWKAGWHTNTQVVIYNGYFYRAANPSGFTDNASQTPDTNSKNWTKLCSISPSTPPASFNVVETLAAYPSPSTWSDPVKGVIHTKVSGTTFQLDIVALDSTDMTKAKIQAGFTGKVKVELLDMSSANNDCSKGKVIQTLSTTPEFLSTDPVPGRKQNISFTENNAWRNVRVRVSDLATGKPTGCSTDNFAIRPSSLQGVKATDKTWDTAGTTRTLNNSTATGGVVHKAGRPFTLVATAYNAAQKAAVTTNYDGTPTVKAVACTLPTPTCVSGTFTPGTFSASNGTVTSSTASYSEAGALNLTLEDKTYANVDAADGSTEAERFIPQNNAVALGRFVPDHFEVISTNTPKFKTFNTTDAMCSTSAPLPKRSFTYIGQAFGYATAPQATVTARNANGQTTQNYSANLWKLTDSAGKLTSTATLTLTYAASAGSLDQTQVNNSAYGTAWTLMVGPGGGTGTLTLKDILSFSRTTPVVPFNAQISLTIDVTDSAENVANQGQIKTTTPLVFNGTGTGIAFDSGNEFRYGILKLSSANGSELVDLPIPMETQYWSAGGVFVTNTADNCTTIPTSSIQMGTYKKNLAACETALDMSGALVQGKSNLKLKKPGKGNDGSVDLTVNLGTTGTGKNCLTALGAETSATAASLNYLKGKWNGSANYDKDPTATATFSVFQNSGPMIYLREMY